jgi:hypothetical protein
VMDVPLCCVPGQFALKRCFDYALLIDRSHQLAENNQLSIRRILILLLKILFASRVLVRTS